MTLQDQLAQQLYDDWQFWITPKARRPWRGGPNELNDVERNVWMQMAKNAIALMETKLAPKRPAKKAGKAAG